VHKELNRTFSSGKVRISPKPSKKNIKIKKTIGKAPCTRQRKLGSQKQASVSKSKLPRKAAAKPKQAAIKRNKIQLDFFFKRTCNRALLAFYKDELKPHLQECLRLKEKEHVLSVIQKEFCQVQ